MKIVSCALLGLLLLGGVSLGQQAGSKAAYRAIADREREAAQAEADWNVAKMLTLGTPEPINFKEAKQDFHSWGEIKDGTTGFVQRFPFKVYSVIDKTNVVLKFDGSLLWVDGFDTKGLAIGDSVRLANPMVFNQTKPYQNNQVMAAKPISPEEFSDQKKKIARDMRKEKSQIFELLEGKTIEAVFVDVRKGKAIFEDLDGNTLEHATAEFNPKSASMIRELFKKKPKAGNTPK